MRFTSAAVPLLVMALTASAEAAGGGAGPRAGAGGAAAPAAATADAAAAQVLFGEARKLMSAGRYAEACPKLEESQKLDAGIGTLFHLADCNEHIGKTATAWAQFLEAAGEAKGAGQMAREKAARERAAALEPKLARLAIQVPSALMSAGVDVRRDGTPVGRAQWNEALPVDPGTHTVTATAPGRVAFEQKVVVAPQSRPSVAIPELAMAPKPVAVAPVPAPASPAAPIATTRTTSGETAMAPAPDVPPPSEGLGTQRTVAIVAGSVGAAAVITGTVLGLVSKSKHDDADAHCTGNVCDAQGVGLKDDAIHTGNASTVAFGIGLAALAGGAALWFTAPKSTSSVSVAPSAGMGSAGLTVRGAF